jgi:hypothetical protein
MINDDCELCKTPGRAAYMGHIKCLIRTKIYEHLWNECVCMFAVVNNNIDCLIYAHKHGCNITTDTCIIAARYGNLGCLIYASENGGIMDDNVVNAAAESPTGAYCLFYTKFKSVSWPDNICDIVSVRDNLLSLYICINNGLEPSASTTNNLILHKHVTPASVIFETPNETIARVMGNYTYDFRGKHYSHCSILSRLINRCTCHNKVAYLNAVSRGQLSYINYSVNCLGINVSHSCMCLCC